MTDTVSVTEAISEADRDAFAREAFAAIEAVLDRRCPELRGVYWTAVDRFYRLEPRPGRPPAAGPDLDLPSTAPLVSGSP